MENHRATNLLHPTRDELIPIDKSLAPLIKKLWKAKVRTYECCRGGPDGDGGTDDGFIIIHSYDLSTTLPILGGFLKKKYSVEKGTGGYCPGEYGSWAKGYKYHYISWKV